MIGSVNMWSDTDQSIVNWTVGLESEDDEAGNPHQILSLRYNDEIQRYSPNLTEDELNNYVNTANLDHSIGYHGLENGDA